MSTKQTHRLTWGIICLLAWSGGDPGLAIEVDSQWIVLGVEFAAAGWQTEEIKIRLRIVSQVP